MNRSKDIAAYRRLLKRVNKAEIAHHLGVSRQFVSKWESVPLVYVERIAQWLNISIEDIIPSFYEEFLSIISYWGAPTDDVLPDLIRLFYPQPKASPCRKPKTRKRKPRK